MIKVELLVYSMDGNMMSKVIKYILTLLICVFLTLIVKLLLGESANIISRSVNTLYYFTPLVAVLIMEECSIKKMFRKYRVNFKDINIQLSLTYVLGTAFLFPALCFLCVYIAGNILGIQSFGRITVPSGDYILYGIMLPENTIVRLLMLYFGEIFIALIAGLTYNMIFSLGSEMGWRGFLGQHLNLGYYKRNILIGLIWGTWFLPVVFFNGTGESTGYFRIIVMYLFFIVSSFLLDTIFRGSRSLFVPAAVRGVISSFTLMSVSGNSLYSAANGLTGIFSLMILSILFFLYVKERTPIHVNV